MKPYLFSFFLLCLLGLSLKADEKNQDWVTHYYKAPSPDRLISEVRALSKAGVLRKSAQPPLVGFMSRIMKANPDHIQKWIVALSDLPQEGKDILLEAAWYSDTKEARKYFKDHGLSKYLKEKAPNILEMDVSSPEVLDMLWGYFMATGRKEPISRIVKAFELSKYQGALKRLKTSEKTEKVKKEAYLEATFQAACWSLESNCKQHPRVLKICEQLFVSDTLSKPERLWLAVILSKVKPEKYTIKIEKNIEPMNPPDNQGGEIAVQIGDTKEDIKFHSNGKKKSAALLKKNQKGAWVPDGIVRTWYPSGNKRGILSFKMGAKHGVWKSYYENGQQYNQREYAEGKLVNTATTWFENGKAAEVTTFSYKKNNMTISQTIYYENGRKKEEGRWVKNEGDENSFKDGLWIFYSDEGTVLKKELYKKGKLIQPNDPPDKK